MIFFILYSPLQWHSVNDTEKNLPTNVSNICTKIQELYLPKAIDLLVAAIPLRPHQLNSSPLENQQTTVFCLCKEMEALDWPLMGAWPIDICI